MIISMSPSSFDDWNPLITTVITIFGSVMASSGFWTIVQRRSDKNDASVRLILGLAHNTIVAQGLAYVERGYIFKDEYDDFVKYLYGPYSTFGGNGLAEKVFKEVTALPIRRYSEDALDRAIKVHSITEVSS